MRGMSRYVSAVILMVGAAYGQTIRSAGELFVHLDVTNVTGLADGAFVSSWTNRGTLAAFVPALPGKGATYAASVGGAAALQFNGTANSVMALSGHTNNATKGGVPLSILGTNFWSAEVWVYNPAGGGAIETLLTWTSRRDAGNYRMMEMRFYNTSDAVEHYGRNLGWGSLGGPTFGQWHHIACTRDAAYNSNIYVDGRLLNTQNMGGAFMLNLATNNALFAIGAVDDNSGWNYPLSGAIAVVRVHSGTLSAADVLNNFTVERGRFGGDWQNAGSAAWNDSANWAGGAVPSDGSPVYISNGGLATYNGAPYAGGVSTGVLYAANGAMVLTGGSFTTLLPFQQDTLVRLGLLAGKTFNLGVAGGTFNTGVNPLQLGDVAGATGAVSFATGGRLVTPRIQKGSGVAQLSADGGTLQAVSSATDFLQALDSAKIKAGGLTFDVPTNVSVSVYQALQEDATSCGGGLAKTGPGTLNLYGANTVTGALAVSGGSLVIQSGALSSLFASPVTLSNGGAIGWNQTGGAAILAANLTPSSTGALTLYALNTNDSINLSSLPGVTLRTEGTFAYTGMLTPYTNLYLFAPNNGTATYTQPITNQVGQVGRVEVRGTSGGFQGLAGNNNYTGGTLLESGGLVMAHSNALSVGSVGVQDIVCRSGTVLRVQAPLNSTNFFSRVAANSVVSLQLNGAGLTNTIDLSACPNLFTGTENTSTKSYFIGTLAPYGTTYLLGNTGIDTGDGSYGFVITSLTNASDGTPRSVLIKGVGVVDTRNSAAYSGGTRVEDGGKIIVIGDGGFGTVPGVFDPSNIVFDGGVLRTETTFVTLAATRGIVFGPKGARIHASGGLPAQLMIPGDIRGTGTLRMTDMGWVTFAGTNNTYNGRVQLENGYGAMMIGNGTNFNWSSTGGIVGTGTRGWLYLNNGGNDTFSDVFSGNGRLTKKGAGTVTLAVPQTFKDPLINTVIEAGTLRYGVATALVSGTGAVSGVVNIWGGAALDVNNYGVTLNGLMGAGCVTNSNGTAIEVQVGSGNVTSAFDGVFASPVTLTKTGNGVLTLGNQNPTRQPVAVSAGTLALNVGAYLTNGVSVASGATLGINGCLGLRGEYFDNTFPVNATAQWPELGNTIASIEAVLFGKTPDLIADTTSFGTNFDSTTSGATFPGKYSGNADYFVTRWKGLFNAETAGSYYFEIFADDGCLLFLDGALVVNNRTGSGTTSGSVTLTAGTHDAYIFFYEKGGIQSVRIWMQPPGGSKNLLPQWLLSNYATRVGGLQGVAGSSLSVTNYANVVLDQPADAAGGRIDGSTSTNALITKQGSGILTLTATGTYNGLTRIAAGGLTLASGVSHTGALDIANGTLTVSGGTSVDTAPVLIGSLSGGAAGTLNLAAKTVLRINQTTNSVFGGTIIGGTSDSVIAKAGAAELVLTNDVSVYPGSWEVVAGKLVIGDGGKLATNAVVAIRAGGLLVFRCAGDMTFAGTVTGGGAIRNEGPGKLTLTGVVSSGLQVAPGQMIVLDGAPGSGALALGACVNEGTLLFKRTGTNYLSAPISGGGSVTVGPTATLLVGQGGFTDNQSVTLSGGSLLLNSGSSLFFDDTLWVTTGVSRFVTNALGKTILELNPNVGNTRGAAYYRQRVSTTNPCVIDVTFHRGVCTNSPGDGFGVFFQNDSRGTNALPTGAWWQGVTPYSPSFGFQYYLMPSSCYLAWVTNGVLVGRVDNSLFTQNNGSFNARMSFDGTKMVIDMQQGATKYSMTNLTAGAQLSAVGATDVWLGVVGGTGGSYGQQLIDALTYTAFNPTLRTYTNTLVLTTNTTSLLKGVSSESGSQPLVVGDVSFGTNSTLNAAPADGTSSNLSFVSFGNLTVSGNSALAIAQQSQAVLRGNTWTFKPSSLLTLTGKVTLPSVVHIKIDGTIPRGRMNLVDLRSAEVTNLAGVTFVLDGDDGKTFLIYRDGWLYTSRLLGMLILLR